MDEDALMAKLDDIYDILQQILEQLDMENRRTNIIDECYWEEF